MHFGMKLARGWLADRCAQLFRCLHKTRDVDSRRSASKTPTPETATTTLPPQTGSPSGEPQGSAPLRVMVGKSLLINTSERLKRISVTDPAVADALVVTPTQVLVHGRSPGEVSLLIWDELERSRSFACA